MAWWTFRLGSLVLAIALASCSSRVKTQYDPTVDFNRFATFGWVARPAAAETRDPFVPMYRPRLERTIEQRLEADGLRRSPSGEPPDLQLEYRVQLNIRQDTWVSNWDWSYSPGAQQAWAYQSDLNRPNIEVREYVVGTLIIELADRRGHVVWHGSGTGSATPPEVGRMLVRKAEAMLLSFPPRKGACPGASPKSLSQDCLNPASER